MSISLFASGAITSLTAPPAAATELADAGVAEEALALACTDDGAVRLAVELAAAGLAEAAGAAGAAALGGGEIEGAAEMGSALGEPPQAASIAATPVAHAAVRRKAGKEVITIESRNGYSFFRERPLRIS
jgi:hypothetical protein